MGWKVIDSDEMWWRGMVGADENVLCGALNCGQTKGDCGVNRAHSRRRYSGEGGREVILQLEGGNICYGCGNGSRGFVRSNPMVSCVRIGFTYWRADLHTGGKIDHFTS